MKEPTTVSRAEENRMIGIQIINISKYWKGCISRSSPSSAKGIKGINLHENDSIVSLSIIDHDKNSKETKKTDKSEINAKEKFILSVTENGFGKRSSHYEYRVTNRGGKGIIGIINSSRNGNVSSSFPVNEGDEIIISTNKGRVIRTTVKEIRIAGRNTQGVRIIKLSGEEKVVSAIKIDNNIS